MASALTFGVAATALLVGTTPASAAGNTGTWCNQSKVTNDVYLSTCVHVLASYWASPDVNIVNYGHHRIAVTLWYNSGGYMFNIATCQGYPTNSTFNTPCHGDAGYGSSAFPNGYAQGQSFIVIDGQKYGTFYSPSRPVW